jgi:hypothetical protein
MNDSQRSLLGVRSSHYPGGTPTITTVPAGIAPVAASSNDQLQGSYGSLLWNDSATSFGFKNGNSEFMTIPAQDPLAVKCVVRANRRRNLAETYTQPLESSVDDDPEVRGYLQTFHLPDCVDEAMIALAKYPDTLAIHHEQYVLSGQISEEDFWCRYFFRCCEKRILKDLRRKVHLGILGQSSRNLYANPSNTSLLSPNFGTPAGGGKAFARAPPPRGYSFPGDSSLDGSRSSLTPDGGRQNVEVSISTSQGPLAKDSGDDRARVGSLKEKLRNWNKVSSNSAASSSAPLTPNRPVTSAAERARRYRERQAAARTGNQ